MATGMEGLGETIEKHPVVVALAVTLVAFLAWMQSRNQPATVTEYTFAGGGKARAIDPNAAAIEQAAIQAGVANLGTIAQLVGLQDSNSAALRGSLAQTEAARATSLAQTDAARVTGLASIDANLRSSLFATEAQRDVSIFQATAQRDATLHQIDATWDATNQQTSAGVTIAQGNNAAQIRAAELTAQSQAAATAAQREAAKLAADNANFAIQADKDKARAAANASIVNGIVNTVGNVISALNPFHWRF